MKSLFLTLFLVALASANLDVQKALDQGVHPLSKAMVDIINNANLSWKAKQHFNETELDDVKAKLGTILAHDIPEKFYDDGITTYEDIPAEYDVRNAHPQCADVVNDIRDQSNCGSCWAQAVVGSISDRICVSSGKQVRVSAEDLLSCCNLWRSFSFCGFGCQGGIPLLAFRYWVKKGIVSGDNFGDKNTCRPYSLKPCAHHTEKGEQCDGMARTPSCKRECVNGADYNKDKTYGSKYYNVKGNVEAIQREIMAHGSVSAGFSVYADFVQYHSGVYESTGGSMLGGHAVRIIGWGTDSESGKPYWTIANSWNPTWGEQGFFKILRGSNHCGIEGAITAGLPK